MSIHKGMHTYAVAHSPWTSTRLRKGRNPCYTVKSQNLVYCTNTNFLISILALTLVNECPCVWDSPTETYGSKEA